ncbi:MAG: DUF4398 domain-containing protein [candidate division KSB1 bacterium]|nr:DUF4398 domain-containing protein [candidate division KSB1 bacterium]
MFKKSLVAVLGILVIAVAFTGCAKAPQALVDSTKAALDAAKAAEADRYVPAEFKAAQDSLNAALAEIETQNAKFALMRSYKKAQASLEAATAKANEAAAKVAEAKEAVKNEVVQKQAELAAAIEEANKLFKKAPRGKESREVLTAIKADIEAVVASQPDIQATFDSGDYLTARDKVNAALAKIKGVTDELNQAIAKKNR